MNYISIYFKSFMRWLELDDRTNVPPISEKSAQDNCKPYPNSVVSVKTIESRS